MGINAAEVEAVAAKAARLDAFVAVPLAQRYTPSPRALASCSLWGALARCRTSTSGRLSPHCAMRSTIGGEARRLRSACTTARGSCG
jgi:hypothetical protein